MSALARLPDFSKEITVIINEEFPEHTTTFTVPECLLTETSDFFKAACCGTTWIESTSRIIKLPDVEHDVFNAYLLWVHRQELPTAHADDALELIEDLARLWLLADRLSDERLRNAVIDAILAELNEFTTKTNAFPPELTAQIWSATTPERSLRRLVTDYYAKHVCAEFVKAEMAEYHPDFTKDLMVKALEIVKDDNHNICPSNRDPYFYHDYDPRHD